MWLYFYAIKTVEIIFAIVETHSSITPNCLAIVAFFLFSMSKAGFLLFQSVHRIPVFLFHLLASFRSLISISWSIQSTNFPHWFLWPTFLIVSFLLLLLLFSGQTKAKMKSMHDEIDYFELKSTRKYHNRTEQKISILNRWINYTTRRKSSTKISYLFYFVRMFVHQTWIDFFLLLLSFIHWTCHWSESRKPPYRTARSQTQYSLREIHTFKSDRFRLIECGLFLLSFGLFFLWYFCQYFAINGLFCLGVLSSNDSFILLNA